MTRDIQHKVIFHLDENDVKQLNDVIDVIGEYRTHLSTAGVYDQAKKLLDAMSIIDTIMRSGEASYTDKTE